MVLLYYLSYAAILAGFAFMTLSLASGLLYISEMIEEHSRLAKTIGQRGIYAIMILHALLYSFDSLPLLNIFFSIFCHAVYLQNFSSTWPLISLSSFSFIASCLLAISDHFIWFFYFSRITREARQSFPRYRGPGVQDDAPGFSEIATFFGVCVWLVPLFLFLSLSANDNALPMSSGVPSTPSAAARPVAPRSNSSLFKSLFNMLPLDSIPIVRSKSIRKDSADGLIAPHSPNPMRRASSPVPPSSPTPMRSPFPGPPPRTPSSSFQQKDPETEHLSSSNFQLGTPPRRSPQVTRRVTADSSSATLSARRVMSLKAD
ncbi:transmembrane adaptor Erv26-domain-containing protein [Hygrophoropsis aurantiaca]|uniref:Transmembrane adaptor Erv26-domain-containing protein n=1 Tax=Hygrophoropsis aurantiaca TaxID=72124 RepID=A0ACB8ADK9_9AGAM|nr:transmembrane adaptor Erv26-domain-containing protein [Hygrophoropsis aurantiaca]